MSQFKEGRKITVAEMAPHVHTFLPNENKVNKISEWLINWIEKALAKGKIRPYDYLPLKGDLAFHIGVSLGTMQNVYRYVEDKGYIQSRQKVGSFIKAPQERNIEKLTSKREVASEAIKNYIIDNNYKSGDTLLSARKLSAHLAIPFATIRIAINSLISENIIKKSGNNFVVLKTDYNSNNKEQQTLVEKIAEYINQYIKSKLKTGDKLPSNNALADMFNVSVKTIHDAVKILSVAGIVKTRRGYYGTVVCDFKEDTNDLYYYEQVEEGIKHYIAENCKVGSKLPTIKNFAEVFNVSTKTIKNALDNISAEGYIHSQRGRYGGSFVVELPPQNSKGYEWLALSPEFEQLN